jgi:Xaa-Pro aminopeptidase
MVSLLITGEQREVMQERCCSWQIRIVPTKAIERDGALKLPSQADAELVRQKQDQAVQYLKDNGIDAWLIFVREGSDDVTTSVISGSNYIVQNAAFIFTKGGRKTAILQPIDVQNKAGIFFDDVIPVGNEIDDVIAKTLVEIDPQRIAVNYSREEFCADGLTHGMYLRLMDLLRSANLEDRVTSAEDIVVHVRSVKAPEEIDRIKKAAEITAAAAYDVMEIMKPGVTERDISEFFSSRASHYGAESITSNVVTNPIGENDKGEKTRPLQPGDVIVSDMGAHYGGFGADLKRCWYILGEGETEVPELLQRQWDACLKTLHHSVSELKAGRPGYEVHDAAWEYMESLGFVRDGHSYGHQLGRRAHDAGPWLGEKENPYRPAQGILQENMVVTLDPTMNRVGMGNPGCYCVGLEEMGVVGLDGGKLIQEPQNEIYLVRF